MPQRRQIYASSNGDRWFLTRELQSGRTVVLHEPNTASGGKPSETEVGPFLLRGNGPEQQELLRLIGTLIENSDREMLQTESAASAQAQSPAPL